MFGDYPDNNSQYTFYPDDSQKISRGTLDTKGSYIGIELGYSLTKSRKLLRGFKK
jgi:hypothetical protein